jgi:hypothetical protein
VATTLKSLRAGAVAFIDWLGFFDPMVKFHVRADKS